MNYQKELDKTLEKLTKEERVPKLFCTAVSNHAAAYVLNI